MTFRVAIAGVGKRSVKVLSYLRAAMPEMQIVGYVDPSDALVPDLQEAGTIPRFEDVPTMLADSRPDMLFVGSPNHLHLEQIRDGLRAGVRIFSEKPIVSTLEQTWELAALLREYGSDQLMIGLVLRYAPQIKDLRAALSQGQLGRIVSMEANEHIEPQHGGFFMRDWRRYTHYSGGFMLEKCCHDIDLYHMIAGARAARVASFGGRKTFVSENAPTDNRFNNLYHTTSSHWETTDDPFRSDADIIDHQNAIIQFENSITMSFHTNLNTPDQSRHFCVIGINGMAEGDLHRGYLKVTDAASNDTLFDRDYTQDPEAMIDHYGSDKQMAQELTEYLRGERPQLPVSVVDAIEAGITAIALDQARVSGQIVDLTETWSRLDSYALRHKTA